ncbi:AP2/ERF domain-containing protein [Psidium guajava]|nr:AP2/ERF domain-containing protein [Psidium guajava]
MVSSGSQGMLSKDQLLHLFHRFSSLTSLPDVKKRISEVVQDKQEAVTMTTEIQEEIFQEMGIGEKMVGKTLCLWGREEEACDEAEFGLDEFSERMLNQQKLQEQQMEMLKYMRQFNLDDQSAILDKIKSLYTRIGTYPRFASSDSTGALQNAREVNESFRDVISGFKNVNID